MAILSLSFVLFLSQKSNFIPTILGITLTLVIFYLLLRIKNNHYSYYPFFKTNSPTKTLPILEESGAFAKFDKNFNITYVSKEFIKIMGIEEGNLLTILKNSSKNDSSIKKMEAAVKHKSTFNDLLELEILNQTYFIDTFIYKIANQNLTKAEYIIRCNDITSYIKTEAELKNQLFLDQSTKLPTRLKLLDVLNQPLKSKSSHAHTLLYIQIDSYEEINEFFGIDVGYTLLQEISNWLQENLPTKNTILYKFEHNNFAMHTTSRINLADLESYLRTLHTKISSANFCIEETSHDISFTIGVARGKKNLLKHAYLALKEAQKANKPYKIFNRKNIQEEKYLQNIKINKNIKEALLDDRIVPFFQPILNIKTNEVEKFESLMRIQNLDNTHQKPAEFLEVAKQSKLYPELTKTMITGSLKRLEFLQMPITINLAIDDILNPKVASFILRKLQRHPFAHLITFEILETNEILNYKKVANFIKKIKAFECKVAIDDFGSGYSNFEQVLKLDIDYIKIDGSLIKNINTNKENEVVIKTIITFAKELGVKTIAEFVSSEAIFEKVKNLGIDYAQGYYIGKPAPITVKK
jgi:diguanylate cyclase (GGDEF)-like protein